MDIKPLLDLTCATVASMIKRLQRRLEELSISPTISVLRKRRRLERRTSGARKLRERHPDFFKGYLGKDNMESLYCCFTTLLCLSMFGSVFVIEYYLEPN